MSGMKERVIIQYIVIQYGQQNYIFVLHLVSYNPNLSIMSIHAKCFPHEAFGEDVKY